MATRRFILIGAAVLATVGVGLAASQVITADPAPAPTQSSAQVLQLHGAASLTWTDEIKDLAAGAQVSRYLDLRNSADSAVRGITATQSTDLGLGSDIFVSFASCAVAWDARSGTCAQGQRPVLVDTSLKDWSAKVSLDTFADFAPGQVRHLKVSVRSAQGGQDRSGKITYTFEGVQRAEDSSMIGSQGTGFGVFAQPASGQSDLSAVQDFEALTGRRASVVSSFWSWKFSSFATARDRLSQVLDSGRSPMITWEPWVPDSDDPTYSLDSIIAGKHDAYITSWATGLRDLGGQVYLRPMHEANGNWYPWAGKDPQEYKQAWRHAHDIFAAAGASNVSFVYSPNVESVGTPYSLSDYYPGSDVVDVLALDGYNCLGSSWRSFSDLFSQSYAQIGALNPKAPIWIGETSTCESGSGIAGAGGHTKAQWITDMLNQNGFDRLKMIVWFNADKEFDWRIDSSPAALQAYRP